MLKQTSNSDKKRKLDESSESSPSKKSKLSPSTSSTNSDLPPTVNKTEHRIVLQRVVNRLTESNIVTDTLSLGDTKFMVSAEAFFFFFFFFLDKLFFFLFFEINFFFFFFR